MTPSPSSIRIVRKRGALLALLLLAAACDLPAPARTADPGRPRLTDARIEHLVAVARELRPDHPELADFLDDMSTTAARDVESGRILPAPQLIGAPATAALAARGEDPAAFVRDLFWIRLVTLALWDRGSVDAEIRALHTDRRKLLLLSWLEDGRRTRQGLGVVLGWLEHVSRDEERAVQAHQEEILDVAFTTLYRPGHVYPVEPGTSSE